MYTWEMNEQLVVRETLHALKPYSNKQIVVKLHPTFYQHNKKIVSEIANEVGTRLF